MSMPVKHSNPYNHPEAFCLMQYQDQVTKEIEILWNSRDGVTPFIIDSRAGNEAQHINWRQDRCCPGFVPKSGMRIFVDASPKHAHIQESARSYVEQYWDLDIGGGMTMSRTMQMSKDQAIEHFIAEWTSPGSPTIIEAE